MMKKTKKRKYIKLKGDEVITDDAKKHAEAFSRWFSENLGLLKTTIYDHCCDEDILHDTYIHIYECIAFKGIVINDFQWYFLRSYYRKLIYKKKKAPIKINIDDDSFAEIRSLSQSYPDPLIDKKTVEKIDKEIMDYVRRNYDEISFSIFEMYIKMLPDISYKKLAEIIGYPFNKIWPVMSEIKKDVVRTFKSRKEFLLSID